MGNRIQSRRCWPYRWARSCSTADVSPASSTGRAMGSSVSGTAPLATPEVEDIAGYSPLVNETTPEAFGFGAEHQGGNMMERKTVAKWLTVTALTCLSLFNGLGVAQAEEGTTVQGSQSSTDADANGGSASGSNSADFNSGPSASGSSSSNSQQLGNNTTTVRQSGSAKSGDSVAGGQVTGIVGGNATVQNQNNASGGFASTGNASLTNSVTGNAGPSATSDGSSQVSQIGSNVLDIDQSGSAYSGDAVQGSQVTGIVGGGEHTVQNQNALDCIECGAFSGDATVDNSAVASAGPFGSAGVDGTAQASQIGDNAVVLSQSAEGASGDALSGSQVTGIVGGSATVQNQNTGDGFATSGSVDLSNTADDVFVGPFAGSIGGNASATQNGDNAADISQDIHGQSGDAVASSSVTGGVGDSGGFFTVQNQQNSTGGDAFTGDFTATNSAVDVNVGPSADPLFGPNAVDGQGTVSQIGDNDAALAQNITGGSGDAVAGSQIAGAVGYRDITVQNSNFSDGANAESGVVDVLNSALGLNVGPSVTSDAANSASAEQIGDNNVSVDQGIDVSSGDAVSGSQVTGAVASRNGEVTIQNTNTSINNDATTGDVFSANEFDVAVGPSADAVDGAASAQQIGDNTLAFAQDNTAASGDAVAGSQVTGVVGTDNATLQTSNNDDGSTATTGTVDATNDASGSLTALADSDTSSASAQTNGDTSFAGDQALSSNSGDAVAGGMVSGVVGTSGASSNGSLSGTLATL